MSRSSPLPNVPAARAPLAVMLLLASALAACSGTGDASGPAFVCPRVTTVADADRLTRFGEGGRDPGNIAFEVEIAQLAGSCGREDGLVDVALQVRFLAERGPAGARRRVPFRYFVAVVDADRRILARESFETAIEFRRNAYRAGVLEELEPRIPLTDGRSGGDYAILVGFELSREELEYNRRRP